MHCDDALISEMMNVELAVATAAAEMRLMSSGYSSPAATIKMGDVAISVMRRSRASACATHSQPLVCALRLRMPVLETHFASDDERAMPVQHLD